MTVQDPLWVKMPCAARPPCPSFCSGTGSFPRVILSGFTETVSRALDSLRFLPLEPLAEGSKYTLSSELEIHMVPGRCDVEASSVSVIL